MRVQVAGWWPQSNLGERRAAHVAVDMMACLESGSLEARPGHGSRKPPARAKDKATWEVCAQVLEKVHLKLGRGPSAFGRGGLGRWGCLWEILQGVVQYLLQPRPNHSILPFLSWALRVQNLASGRLALRSSLASFWPCPAYCPITLSPCLFVCLAGDRL